MSRVRIWEVTGAAALGLVGGWLVYDDGRLRVAVALAVGFLLAALALLAPRWALLSLVVWLAALGTLRRVVSTVVPAGSQDVLLLVGPLTLAALVIVAARRPGMGRRSLLANAVLILSVLIILGAVNPLQGGVAGGIAGLLFVLVPTLGFWVGRSFGDDRTMRQLLMLVALLALFAAVYGLVQIGSGFPFWDAEWIRDSGYTALSVGGETRPFASFSAASEYTYYLAIGLVCAAGFFVRGGRFLVGVPTVALLGVALFLGSSRGVIFALAAALALMLAAWRGSRLPRALVAVVIAVLLVPPIAAHFISDTAGSNSTSTLVSHQLGGLADPTAQKSSTLLGHLELVQSGLTSAISQPLGVGIGPISIAASKFDNGVNQNTEADPSNVAVALGAPGLIAYAVVFLVGLGRAYRLAARRRDALAVVVLGLLVVTLMKWLEGGQYAVAVLPWLCLGWVDRAWNESRAAEASAPALAVTGAPPSAPTLPLATNEAT